MEQIGKINNRIISFVEFDTSKNWAKNFPNKNWCIIVIADEKNEKYFDEIIRKSIDKNVAYICSVGKQHEIIHNMADEEIVFREVDIDNLYLPKHNIITVGDEDFENGIWFGIYLTQNEKIEIKEIVILDITKNAKENLTELVAKFENGYLP